MLYNKEFLKKLDKYRSKTIYGRITALQFNELPIQTIEGQITGGSINVDGSSAVRRTCSLTMVAQNVDINGYYWGLNTKFKLEVGVQNTIDKNYPDIIWFPQGIFIITSFSTSLSATNYNINLQGTDKMCLLNGEVGGSLTAPTQFDSWEEETPDGEWKIEKYPIKDIIRDAIHQYAGEPMSNIIINDLDDLGLQLLEYRYDTPMFLLREKDKDVYTMGTLNGNTTFDNGIKLNDKDNVFDPLMNSLLVTEAEPTVFTKSGKQYCAAKLEFGDTAGFRLTELVYPEDLIGNVGESITSILDKIKNLLGQFEYFYDLDGRFVFQKKQDFVNTVWTPEISNEDDNVYVEGIAYSSSSAYSFIGNELITAFSNSPNLNNLRNDYSVWGSRKGSGGTEIPIHMRYSIDSKPIYYKSIDTNIEYCTQSCGTAIVTDWREIIFQMQKDYRKHNHDDDFELKIIQNNPPKEEINFAGYTTGQTGYEQYYIDIEGFWRQLYYPKYAYEEDKEKINNKIASKQAEVILAARSSDTTLYDSRKEELENLQEELEIFQQDYINEYYQEGEANAFWHKNVFTAPNLLNYWIDFLDADGVLNQFSSKVVGSRPKAINDTNIKSIYFRETPNIIFATNEEIETKPLNSGYRYFQCPESSLDSMFSISAQGISAKEKIDELLYQHSYCIESANVTAIPVYYLQPNTRIYIYDKESGINGDYIVSKITFPLTYNGTMQLTTTKAAEQGVI